MSEVKKVKAQDVQESLKKTEAKQEEAVDASKIIKELIDTSFGGSNKEQAKAVQLLKGLAFSDDPLSNKFMSALDKFTSGLNPKNFGSK